MCSQTSVFVLGSSGPRTYGRALCVNLDDGSPRCLATLGCCQPLLMLHRRWICFSRLCFRNNTGSLTWFRRLRKQPSPKSAAHGIKNSSLVDVLAIHFVYMLMITLVSPCVASSCASPSQGRASSRGWLVRVTERIIRSFRCSRGDVVIFLCD